MVLLPRRSPSATLDLRCLEPNEARVMQVLTSLARVARGVAAAASSLAGFVGISTGMCESVPVKLSGSVTMSRRV